MQTNSGATRRYAAFNDTDLLTENEVAGYLRVSTMTLRNWRWKRTGPRFTRIGERIVRYPFGEVRAFLEAGDAGNGGAA